MTVFYFLIFCICCLFINFSSESKFAFASSKNLACFIKNSKPNRVRVSCRTSDGSLLTIKLHGFDRSLQSLAIKQRLKWLEARNGLESAAVSDSGSNRALKRSQAEIVNTPEQASLPLGWWIQGFGPKLSRLDPLESPAQSLEPGSASSGVQSSGSVDSEYTFRTQLFLRESEDLDLVEFSADGIQRRVRSASHSRRDDHPAFFAAINVLETAFNATVALASRGMVSSLYVYPSNFSEVARIALTDSECEKLCLPHFFTRLKPDGFSRNTREDLVPWQDVYASCGPFESLPLPVGVIELLRLHETLSFLQDDMWRQDAREDALVSILEGIGVEVYFEDDFVFRRRRPPHAKCPMRSDFFIIEARIAAALSFFTLSLMFVIYWNAPALRNPANRLFMLDAISLIVLSVMHFISRWGPTAGDSSFLCQMQAFTIHFMELADAFNMASLGVNILLIVIWHKEVSALHRLQRLYAVLNFGVPFLLTLPLYFYKDKQQGSNAFGDACLWCWIKRGRSDLRLSLFVPVWLVFAFLAVSFTFAALHIRRLESEFEHLSTAKTLDLRSANFEVRAVFVQMAVRYCCAFFLRWIFPTINRIREYMVVDIQPDDWAQLLQALITPSSGSIMFALFLSNNWPHLKRMRILPAIPLPFSTRDASPLRPTALLPPIQPESPVFDVPTVSPMVMNCDTEPPPASAQSSPIATASSSSSVGGEGDTLIQSGRLTLYEMLNVQ